MKHIRVFAILLVVMLIVASTAFAAPDYDAMLKDLSYDELIELKDKVISAIRGSDEWTEPADASADVLELQSELKAANAQIAELKAQLEATPEPTAKPTPKPTEEPAKFETVSKGSKGDTVVKIQERLKELGYLAGKADGSYGNQSASAVSDFQAAAGLPKTGEVDETTYNRLMSSSAPKSPNPVMDETLYEDLDYDEVARDPDSYTGTLIKYKGKVIQVSEGDGFTVMRIATSGNYDDVVYTEYTRPAGAKRILEDDKVTVYGVCYGVYTYTSTMGGAITIPACVATSITLR